jgi:hypothetical protein
MTDKTTISVFKVDAAEWSKFCRLAEVTSPEAYHKLMVYALSGDLVAIIKPKKGAKA